MRARRCLWLRVLLLGTVLAGCAGGRGSSGFDVNAENTAIGRALLSQQCVEFGGLTICPANQSTTPALSASPTPTPSSTPGNPTPPSVTPTATGSRTVTATPRRSPGVDTALGNATSIDCIQHQPGGPCSFTLTFIPQAFAPTAAFRVATRAVSPDGPWRLGPDPVEGGDPQGPTFEVPLVLVSTQSAPPAHVQFVVLAFSAPPHTLPAEFQELRVTNAAFAFVTQVLSVNVVTAYPPLGSAPEISYFGLARADEVVLIPTAVDADGRPIYVRSSGEGVFLIVEARPGTTGVPVGTQAFSASGGLPDLQMLVARPLGNASLAVCDKTLPDAGGVPATDPLVFSDAPAVVDAINDLGCRVDDGAGAPQGRGAADACTIPNGPSAEFAFVNRASAIQFCLPVTRTWGFPAGDTTVAARVRDADGQVSLPQEIIVRVAPPLPTPGRPTVVALSPTHTPSAAPIASLPTRTATSPRPTAVPPTQAPTPIGTPIPPEPGPQITYLGVTRADGVLIPQATTDANGRPIYIYGSGSGIVLVIEAQPGVTQQPIGSSAFDPTGGLPDLQILVSRPLGDGSPRVCDKTTGHIGGVPATDPLAFSDAPAVVDAINDLGCRVDDGTGNPFGRSAADACTIPNAPSGEFAFVNTHSTLQYCLPIVRAWAFPLGDTIVAARVRNTDGTVGRSREVVVRVVPLVPTPTRTSGAPRTVSSSKTPSPTPTATPVATVSSSKTPSPTPTATPATAETGPLITYLGLARADGVPIVSTTTDAGRRVYARAGSSGMILVIEARPGAAQPPVGGSSFDPSGGLPDLQILVSRPLGDGSPIVCDRTRPDIGGVPGTEPLAFSDARTVVDAINDLGCRVDNGAGQPVGRSATIDACTIPNAISGEFGFVDARSTIQYCVPIVSAWAFLPGDTMVAARVRDVGGTVGLPSEIVVRVAATP